MSAGGSGDHDLDTAPERLPRSPNAATLNFFAHVWRGGAWSPPVGVTAAGAEFLVEAAGQGVSFERTLTIGRQSLLVGPDLIWSACERHSVRPSVSKRAFRRELGWSPWAEPFFRLLGAREITALDASGYEGAGVVHDLNKPVPSELHAQFDVLFDGGTLEHVFNAPVALRSYMEMVAVGGHLFVHTHANNYFGHGFYQFGAEFFYRALSAPNGYSTDRILLCDEDTDAPGRFRGRVIRYPGHGPCYAVADPYMVGQRVSLVNDRPTTLLVQAGRTAIKPIFQVHPQQSDYMASWAAMTRSSQGPAPYRESVAKIRALARKFLPSSARQLVIRDVLLRIERDWIPRSLPLLDPLRRRRAARERSLGNRRSFRRMDP